MRYESGQRNIVSDGGLALQRSEGLHIQQPTSALARLRFHTTRVTNSSLLHLLGGRKVSSSNKSSMASQKWVLGSQITRVTGG